MLLLVGRRLSGVDHGVVVGGSRDAHVCGRVRLGLGLFVRASLALWLAVTDHERKVVLALMILKRMRERLIVVVIGIRGELVFFMCTLAFAGLQG